MLSPVPVPVERIDLWVVDLDRWMGTADRPTSRSGRRRGGGRPPTGPRRHPSPHGPPLAHTVVGRRRTRPRPRRPRDRPALPALRRRRSRSAHREGWWIEFSVSSSGRLAAVAVADPPVGWTSIGPHRCGPVGRRLLATGAGRPGRAGRAPAGRGTPPSLDGEGGRAEGRRAGPGGRSVPH